MDHAVTVQKFDSKNQACDYMPRLVLRERITHGSHMIAQIAAAKVLADKIAVGRVMKSVL